MTRRTDVSEAGVGITRRTPFASVGIAAAMASMPPAFAADDPKRISIRLGSRDIGSVDPAMTKTGDDETVALQIFNPLVSPPRGTLDVDLDKLQPVLAKSWEISPDRKTWTFHL